MNPERQLVTSWLELFGDRATRPRDVIDVAFDPLTDPALRLALSSLLPGIDEHLSPSTLGKYLALIENQALPNGSARYRFSRVGHRWRLLPALSKAPNPTTIDEDWIPIA